MGCLEPLCTQACFARSSVLLLLPPWRHKLHQHKLHPRGPLAVHAAVLLMQADAKEYTGSGDVKYHLGTSFKRPTASGKQVYLALVANPRCGPGQRHNRPTISLQPFIFQTPLRSSWSGQHSSNLPTWPCRALRVAGRRRAAI